MTYEVILVQSQGQWLALAGGELVAAGESFEEVWDLSCTPRKGKGL